MLSPKGTSLNYRTYFGNPVVGEDQRLHLFQNTEVLQFGYFIVTQIDRIKKILSLIPAF